jgi:hypothetical protein
MRKSIAISTLCKVFILFLKGLMSNIVLKVKVITGRNNFTLNKSYFLSESEFYLSSLKSLSFSCNKEEVYLLEVGPGPTSIISYQIVNAFPENNFVVYSLDPYPEKDRANIDLLVSLNISPHSYVKFLKGIRKFKNINELDINKFDVVIDNRASTMVYNIESYFNSVHKILDSNGLYLCRFDFCGTLGLYPFKHLEIPEWAYKIISKLGHGSRISNTMIIEHLSKKFEFLLYEKEQVLHKIEPVFNKSKYKYNEDDFKVSLITFVLKRIDN